MHPALRPVGIVSSDIKEPFLTAADDGLATWKNLDQVRDEVRRMKARIATIVINEDLVKALEGIDNFSHLLVLYWAHKVPGKGRGLRRVHPMGRKEIPVVGLFCTFSPARPNPVLACIVRLHERKDNILKVSGLDAIDGSPVIDIKPYVDHQYPREGGLHSPVDAADH